MTFGQREREFHHRSELTITSHLYASTLGCRLPFELQGYLYGKDHIRQGPSWSNHRGVVAAW